MAQYSSSKLDRPEPGLIKWSPNPAYDVFLHVNLQHRVVQLYEPTGHVQRGQFDYEKLSKFDEIPPLNTYDWSPAHPGFVAVGTASGTVNLLNLHDASNQYLEQRLKITRPCQAVAFNTGTLLAVGLERVRNDQCLQVWDVNHLVSVDWPSLEGSDFGESVHRLEPSTSVSSTKFFEDSPQTLVAGIKNQGIRIYDLRDPHGAVINYQTKCNNNLAIDYADPNYFASSSLDRPGVIIWDRRATSRPSSSPSYLDAVDTDGLPWGAALNLERAIDINPSNVPERGSLIRSLRFCRDQGGLIAVLSRTGQLRVLDTKKEFTEPEKQYDGSPELLETRRSYELDMEYGRQDRKHDQIVSFDWVTLDSPTLTPRAIVLRASGAYDILEKPSYTSEHIYKMVPWQAPYRGLEEGSRYHSIMQFEAPQYAEMMGPLLLHDALKDIPLFGEEVKSVTHIVQQIMQSHPPEADPIIDSEARDVFPPIPNTASTAFTAETLRGLRDYSNETLNLPKTPFSSKRQPSTIEKLDKSLTDLSVKGVGPISNRELHEKLLATTLDTAGFPKMAQVVLDHVMLLRSKERYLFDYAANRDIVSDDPWLRDLWDWVAGAAQAASDDGMISQGIDLSYLGIVTIWKHDLGLQSASRLANGPTLPGAKTWERCLQAINSKTAQPSYNGVETKRPAHRQAAIRMCRWGRSVYTDYNDYAKSSPSDRHSSWHTMATARALFEGDTNEAVQILKRASTEYPELLFVSLALQLIGRGDIGLAKEQLDFDDAVASKTDPYLRAISSLIATNNWEAIANQESLPLRERTYVALRYFDDDTLTRWLDKQLEKAVETGDLEGIVLTGITDRLVDIFASYIEKFNDVQTATLVLSICSPRYINDYRTLAWRNAYRAYLQRHKAFMQRTKFEVESTKKSKRGGVPTIKPPSRQIALRCVYCDAEYELSKTGTGPPSTAQGQANPLAAANISAGISCPNCGRHLPRCVVCLEVVGIPRSDKPEASPDPQIRVAAKFPTFCLKCDHVLHLDHARQWFARHVECPVPECRCRCNFRANPELSYH
ncbi:Uu.00g059440.m01.CDS01 [Anthostomella pinea]|uniref:Uu.00g059440.m01.CDS01 n=1 Tax=Anthostomella pinea TaxID=933095 RepID=A0AAI8VSQ7_9PEZI|nr:Uu.00g059440.m01.CDS01 [Anthostomella pinea]